MPNSSKKRNEKKSKKQDLNKSDEKISVNTDKNLKLKCERIECEKEASFRCPICAKAGAPDSLYCSQECFNLNWKNHKKFHLFFLKKPAEDNGGYVPWPDFQFTGKIRPFPKGPKRVVPEHINPPDYANHPKGVPLSEIEMKNRSVIRVLNENEIKAMRVASKLGREVLDEAAKAIRVGVTTEEIDRVVFDACIERDCYPSPLNYYGFYASCCTSVNEVICHGVPDQRELQEGDICNVDVTVFHNGFHGDLNETFFVGEVSKPHKKLVNVTYECLMKAIKLVKPGTLYRQIGNVIHKHASANGFDVVRTYCGHGIHELFHTLPNVPHFANNKAIGVMKPGHCFTIEPMLTEGNWREKLWPDNWTVVTEDGSWSAQFEHTLLVTEIGCDILTKRQNESGNPHFLD